MKISNNLYDTPMIFSKYTDNSGEHSIINMRTKLLSCAFPQRPTSDKIS